MTEKSYWWTTGGAGDGASTYTQQDHSDSFKVVAACLAFEGVAPAYLNALVGSVPAANTARIGTGGAMVDGRPYSNSAAVDVNIPSAVGGGNTRIDRVVLRANWAARTVRITRLPGTDAASPSVPGITSVSGTTYDIKLYQVLVDTAGAVTLTDEHVWAQLTSINGLADLLITAAKIANTTITTGKIALLAITTALLADHAVTFVKMVASAAAGLSVVGRSVNSAGDFAEIVAANDGEVFHRSGATVGFGKLADANVTAGGLTNASLANRTRAVFISLDPGPLAATPKEYNGVQLADGIQAQAVGGWKIPVDYVSGLTLKPVVIPLGTGNMSWICVVEAAADGEAFTTHNIGSGIQTTAVVNTIQKVLTALDLAAGGALAGDYLQLQFMRRGADGSDTVGASVYCLGVLMEYTADM